MTDHPSTFRGPAAQSGEIAWDDRAALHRIDDGDGLLDGANALRRDSFAGLIRHLMRLPESERMKYEIEKAGDRKYSVAEAAELYVRSDFPQED